MLLPSYRRSSKEENLWEKQPFAKERGTGQNECWKRLREIADAGHDQMHDEKSRFFKIHFTREKRPEIADSQ